MSSSVRNKPELHQYLSLESLEARFQQMIKLADVQRETIVPIQIRKNIRVQRKAKASQAKAKVPKADVVFAGGCLPQGAATTLRCARTS